MALGTYAPLRMRGLTVASMDPVRGRRATVASEMFFGAASGTAYTLAIATLAVVAAAQGVTPRAARALPIGAGVYSAAVQDVALRAGRRLPLDVASFAMAAQAVTLTVTSASSGPVAAWSPTSSAGRVNTAAFGGRLRVRGMTRRIR